MKKQRLWPAIVLSITAILATGIVASQVQKPPLQKLPEITAIQPPKMIVALGCGLTIPLLPQETNVWCWAASGEMVMENLEPGLDIQQCEEANIYFSQNNCCANPFPDPCVLGGWDVLDHYGFSFDRNDWNPLSWPSLKQQLCDKKPVMYAWAWDGGGGHMMVVTGWSETPTDKYAHINDPWPPNVGDSYVLTYEAWVDGDGYRHWADYYNIQKKPSAFKPTKISSKAITYPPPGPPPELASPAGPEMQKAAVAARQALEKMVTPEMAPGFGFENKADAGKAILGTPVREYRIHLNELRALSPGQEPRSIFRGGNRLLYPLLINGRARSAIRVETYKGKTRLNRMGNTSLIRMLEPIAGPAAFGGPAGSKSLAALEIPALGLYFLIREQGKKIQLASLFDVSYLDLKMGKFESAHDVFKRLQSYSRKVGEAPM